MIIEMLMQQHLTQNLSARFRKNVVVVVVKSAGIIMHPSKRFAQTVERPAKPIVRGRTNNQPTNQYLFNFLTVDIIGQSKAGIFRSLLLIQNV
jgi:hypothetical protein